MEMRRLGSLEVSLVGLGCNNFGMRCDEALTRKVVDAAIDAGINFFDTADVYGGTLSETYLGKALAGRRDEVVIATKFGSPVGGDQAKSGASAAWVTQACEDSLRRLGTDRIDLYQQHRPDPSTPIEETLGALDELVRAGKVVEIGNSNFDPTMLADADATSRQKGIARFVSAQNELNILRRAPLAELLPTCERLGLGFLPFFPLASGLLTGKYQRNQPAPEGTRLAALPPDRAERVFSERTFDQVEALGAFAAARDHTLLELAFAWLAS